MAPNSNTIAQTKPGGDSSSQENVLTLDSSPGAGNGGDGDPFANKLLSFQQQSVGDAVGGEY